MGFFQKFFGKSAPPAVGEEQAVLLHFRLDATWPTQAETERYHALQELLAKAVDASEAGELDGDEFGEGECVVFLYGPSAEALWDAIAPVLEKEPLPHGSFAIKRFGGPECGNEERIRLGWDG